MPIDYIDRSGISEVPDQGKKIAKMDPLENRNRLALGTENWISSTPLLPICVVSEENGIVSMISLQE